MESNDERIESTDMIPTDTTERDDQDARHELSQSRDNEDEPDKKTQWLAFFLRIFLLSPIKWKSEGCWISIYHLFWFAVFITKLCYLTKLTFQIGHCREDVSSRIQDGYIALHHTLLKHWDASFETLPYPPSTGKFAVYNMDDLQKRINFAVENIFNAEVTATGFFKKFRDDTVTIEVINFDLRNSTTERHSFKDIVTNIHHSFEPFFGLSTYTDDVGNILYRYNITKDLVMHNMSSALDRMLLLEITFSLHTLRVSNTYNDSRCHHIYGNVTFNDEDHNGQVLVDLTTNTIPIRCAKMKYSLKDSPHCRDYTGHTARHVQVLSIITAAVDIFTFLGGCITILLTFCHLRKNYHAIYGSQTERDNLPITEFVCNIKLWQIPSVTADIFTLLGVTWILSTLGEDNDFMQPLQQWDEHVVFLGSGCLLTWISLLRFMKINNKFTLLFKTLKRSAVDIIFFMTCVAIIFAGFLSCTYIVLGPYHVKFQQLSTTAEALFSMINGDEIFVAFALLQEAYTGDDNRVRIFSRVIIYGFVTIFTVFVLNLLIALFNNGYEVVKKSYDQQMETNKDSVPNTLSHFMLRDISDCASSDRRCNISCDEKNSLISCKKCTFMDTDCTCGLFSTIGHVLYCNVFAVCCCNCKKVKSGRRGS